MDVLNFEEILGEEEERQGKEGSEVNLSELNAITEDAINEDQSSPNVWIKQ